MARKLTRAEKRIAGAKAADFRKLTKAELEKLGHSAKSSRYIEIGKRVAKNTKTISKRLFTVKMTGASPEALARAHAEGELIYKSRETQKAAEKQRLTREKLRETRLVEKQFAPLTLKQIDRKSADFEKRLTGIDRVKPGPHAKRPRDNYRVSTNERARMPDLLRKKLAGEHLPDGDWHQLADMMRAAKHPDLARVLKS